MTFSEHRPQLIAHRGYSECYPENTLVGLEAALREGADCIEFDVQFSSDGVPFVIHDDELERTTGIKGRVSQFASEQLVNISAGQKERFGNRFKDESVPTLRATLELLNKWPGKLAFVEIKNEAITFFGLEKVVRDVVSFLVPLGDRCILISSNYEAPGYAKSLGMKYTGWVVPEWNRQSQTMAQALEPDVLFCNYKKITGSDELLWPGPWQWALYDIVDPETALTWIRRGVKFIESWDVGRLLGDQQLVSCLRENIKKT